MNRSAVVFLTLTLTASAVTAVPASALPLISEVFYDALGGDDAQSFVELYGEPGSSVDGLTLEGVNGSGGAITHSIALSGTIPADGFFVLADVDGSGATLVPDPDAVANVDFQNGPDSVVLRDSFGIVDAVGYGVFDAGDVCAGEGTPAPDGPAGSSLARVFANLDSDDNGLDFILLDAPTPGTAPLLVPEPGTGALVVSALLTVVATGRRSPSSYQSRVPGGVGSGVGFSAPVDFPMKRAGGRRLARGLPPASKIAMRIA